MLRTSVLKIIFTVPACIILAIFNVFVDTNTFITMIITMIITIIITTNIIIIIISITTINMAIITINIIVFILINKPKTTLIIRFPAPVP